MLHLRVGFGLQAGIVAGWDEGGDGFKGAAASLYNPNGDNAAGDILNNTALLVIPAVKVAPALGTGGKQAVKASPDVLVPFDDVVAARFEGGAILAAIEGSIDDLDRVVVLDGFAGPAPRVAVEPAAPHSVVEVPSIASRAPSAPSRIAQSRTTIRRVALSDLPPEVSQTLARIRAGGPFRYSEDGAIFFNRQEQLPHREAGYYREFTVETPGLSDRGRRRLVVGGEGAELYFSDDHYRTFREVVEAND